MGAGWWPTHGLLHRQEDQNLELTLRWGRSLGGAFVTAQTVADETTHQHKEWLSTLCLSVSKLPALMSYLR